MLVSGKTVLLTSACLLMASLSFTLPGAWRLDKSTWTMLLAALNYFSEQTLKLAMSRYTPMKGTRRYGLLTPFGAIGVTTVKLFSEAPTCLLRLGNIGNGPPDNPHGCPRVPKRQLSTTAFIRNMLDNTKSVPAEL